MQNRYNARYFQVTHLYDKIPFQFLFHNSKMSHVRSRRRGQQLEDDHSEGEEVESVADSASDVGDSSADEDSSSDDDSEDDESASESDNDDESQAAPADNPPAQKGMCYLCEPLAYSYFYA